jgi:AraC-like DNA-binding protein
MLDPEAKFWINPSGLIYHWSGKHSFCHRACLHFSNVPEILASIVPPQGQAVKLSAKELKEAKEIVRDALPHYLHPNRLSSLFFERSLIDLSMLALKTLAQEKIHSRATSARDRVERAISFYLENVRRNPKLHEISCGVKMSTSQLRRLFFTVKDETPHRYFHQLRMERIAHHLSTTDEPLAQVAASYQFSDETDLCRTFKKIFKVSPHTWRRNIVSFVLPEPESPLRTRPLYHL